MMKASACCRYFFVAKSVMILFLYLCRLEHGLVANVHWVSYFNGSRSVIIGSQ